MNKPNIFDLNIEHTFVDVYAYCLMPNHFHLCLSEKCENGAEHFMRKLCTAYSMYFNKKYIHSGTIFQGKYKLKYVTNQSYLFRVIEYIHLNPYGIEEPDMTHEAKIEHREDAIKISKKYDFSSYKDHLGCSRQQEKILSPRSDLGWVIT